MAELETLGTEVLLIGGRSGVGKSTIGYEISRQLAEAGCAHCFIEGDNLDQIYPAPMDDPVRAKITEANLQSIWANFRALGQNRLIYTNTASLMFAPEVERAVGGNVKFFGVLLTASDDVAANRLRNRELGGGLQRQLERSARAARWLDTEAPAWAIRISTDGRGVSDIAREIVSLTEWNRQ